MGLIVGLIEGESVGVIVGLIEGESVGVLVLGRLKDRVLG